MSWDHDGTSDTDAGIEHLDGLYSYAMVLSRNHAEAEDLVQETYVRAIQAMKRLRADSNMKSWLFTILRNIWFNQLRKRRNGPQMIEIEVGDGVSNSIAEPSKNSHDLYVSKVEAEQVGVRTTGDAGHPWAAGSAVSGHPSVPRDAVFDPVAEPRTEGCPRDTG